MNGRQAFNLGGPVLVKQFLDDIEDAGGAGFDSWDYASFYGEPLPPRARRPGARVVMNRDLVAPRFESQKGTHAEKGVPADFFAAFDGFEEEGVRLSLGDREESRDRREQVGRDGLGHGNERGLPRQPCELVIGGTDHSFDGTSDLRNNGLPGPRFAGTVFAGSRRNYVLPEPQRCLRRDAACRVSPCIHSLRFKTRGRIVGRRGKPRPYENVWRVEPARFSLYGRSFRWTTKLHAAGRRRQAITQRGTSLA